MKLYLQIVWENLFLKTFDFKGRTNCSAYITCTIFWWIIFLLSIPCFALMDFGYDFLGIIAGVLSAIALYLQLIPFTSLRVRRLHDIGERGSKLILLGCHNLRKSHWGNLRRRMSISIKSKYPIIDTLRNVCKIQLPRGPAQKGANAQACANKRIRRLRICKRK